jgi:hypothetical protein
VKRIKKHKKSKRGKSNRRWLMKSLRSLTDLLGIAGDMIIALLTMLGQEVRQVTWVIRIALYGLQAFFAVVDCGHGKVANISFR